VKDLQLESIKTLIYDYQASIDIPNSSGKSPLDLAKTTVKPPKGSKASADAIREHVAGFL